MGGAPIVHLEAVDSTMDELAAMLAAGDLAPWTAVVADYQRKGRGRAERNWTAPARSALLTTIYAPIEIDHDRVGMLAIAAGLAIADSLSSYGVAANLKWPNDVLVDDRKLAGVLISTRLCGRIETSVGIGLNLSASPPGAVSVTELVPLPPSALAILKSIRMALVAYWSDLEAGRFAVVSERWNSLAAWIGQDVHIPGEVPRSGKLIGIDEWGRLLLDTSGGEVALNQSEILRGPLPGRTAPYT